MMQPNSNTPAHPRRSIGRFILFGCGGMLALFGAFALFSILAGVVAPATRQAVAAAVAPAPSVAPTAEPAPEPTPEPSAAPAFDPYYVTMRIRLSALRSSLLAVTEKTHELSDKPQLVMDSAWQAAMDDELAGVTEAADAVRALKPLDGAEDLHTAAISAADEATSVTRHMSRSLEAAKIGDTETVNAETAPFIRASVAFDQAYALALTLLPSE